MNPNDENLIEEYTVEKYRQHSKVCMWRKPGHFYMVLNMYDSKVTRGKREAHAALN